MFYLQIIELAVDAMIFAWFSCEYMCIESDRKISYLIAFTAILTAVLWRFNLDLHKVFFSALQAAVMFAVMWFFRDRSLPQRAVSALIYILMLDIIVSTGEQSANLLVKIYGHFAHINLRKLFQQEVFQYMFFLSRPLIIVLLGMVNRFFRKYQTMQNRYAPLFILIFLMLDIVITALEGVVYRSADNIKVFSPVIILLSAVAFLMYYIFNQSSQDSFREKQASEISLALQNTMENAEFYTQKESELRIIRHDLKNQFLILHSYLENGEYEKCEDIVQRTLQQLNEMPVHPQTGYSAIDAVISVKFLKAKASGIRTASFISVRCLKKETEYDIAMIIGNLLDNAIENNISDPARAFIRLKTEQNDSIVISVSNSTEGGDFKTEKENKKDHGIGLSSVRQIASMHNGGLSADIHDGTCTTVVILNDI